MEELNSYVVISPVQHDGLLYRPDKDNVPLIVLTATQAEPLLALGVIRVITSDDVIADDEAGTYAAADDEANTGAAVDDGAETGEQDDGHIIEQQLTETPQPIAQAVPLTSAQKKALTRAANQAAAKAAI